MTTKPKYKLGDTVFFYIDRDGDNDAERKQTFGTVKKTTIQIDDSGATTFYDVNDQLVEECNVVGRAVIQTPRVRKNRARKTIDEMKSMGTDQASA